MAGVSYLVAQQIGSLIVLVNPDHIIQGWHLSLLTIATAIFCIAFNTLLVRRLPLLQFFALGLHVLGFFVILIVLWVMGPRGDAKTVFTDFEDNSGWGSIGLATLVGILGPLNTLGGADAVVHVGEEMRDASRTLPLTMVINSTINYILAFVMTVTVMFTVGDDVESIFATPTGQPYIQILLNATGSRGATIVLTIVLIILFLFCAINQGKNS